MPRPKGAVLVHAPFSGVRQKTALPAADRYALSLLRARLGDDVACQEILRMVIQAGLSAYGFDGDKRRVEYTQYAMDCVNNGTTNEFESR